ncbi:MAG TPA: anhydro-N-acetylmuramic acid kinase, partial [Flavobacteriales bacterium]|nr:anhydro-N-acetylmuramic acid kinase [Flavobacteriales bacterium]
GAVLPKLLEALNALPFYRQPPPRSLGREWFEEQLKPLIATSAPLADRLSTAVEHIAVLVAGELGRAGVQSALFTGGGAHNGLLVERISTLGPCKPVLPSAAMINFKEAVIFAFLGLMRWRGEVNTLASVTGAAHDSTGGAIYLPN